MSNREKLAAVADVRKNGLGGKTVIVSDSPTVDTDAYTAEDAAKDAKVEVTKADMRKKENKLSAEDKAAHVAIMDSILGTES